VNGHSLPFFRWMTKCNLEKTQKPARIRKAPGGLIFIGPDDMGSRTANNPPGHAGIMAKWPLPHL